MKIKTLSRNTIVQFSSVATVHMSRSLYLGTICSVYHLNQSTSSCDSLSKPYQSAPRLASNINSVIRKEENKNQYRASADARRFHSAVTETSCLLTLAIALVAPVGLISWVSS